jgi:ketosteroid isomerase-like protein
MATPDGELPPTGRTVRSRFAAVATTRGDKIESVRLYLDSMAFMAQLGLAPEPALP